MGAKEWEEGDESFDKVTADFNNPDMNSVLEEVNKVIDFPPFPKKKETGVKTWNTKEGKSLFTALCKVTISKQELIKFMDVNAEELEELLQLRQFHKIYYEAVNNELNLKRLIIESLKMMAQGGVYKTITKKNVYTAGINGLPGLDKSEVTEKREYVKPSMEAIKYLLLYFETGEFGIEDIQGINNLKLNNKKLGKEVELLQNKINVIKEFEGVNIEKIMEELKDENK